jgi:hypothetical protein
MSARGTFILCCRWTTKGCEKYIRKLQIGRLKNIETYMSGKRGLEKDSRSVNKRRQQMIDAITIGNFAGAAEMFDRFLEGRRFLFMTKIVDIQTTAHLLKKNK